KLLQGLEGQQNRKAQFRTVISYVQGGQEWQFEGICTGRIIEIPRGTDGFGYDPVRQGVVANTGPGFSFSTASLGEGNSAFGLNIGTFKRLTNLNMALEMLESESKVRII
ncbi:MAG: non-canonical purine NTP pyrophosphatase, partial [bacterium]